MLITFASIALSDLLIFFSNCRTDVRALACSDRATASSSSFSFCSLRKASSPSFCSSISSVFFRMDSSMVNSLKR